MINKPKYKVCRRLGSGVYEKCQTQKFTLSEAKHAKTKKFGNRKSLSSFASQLLEKQKIRYTYGLSEKQFSNYIKVATISEGTNTSEKLFVILESRLDNIIYKIGIAETRPLARQMVSHGHFTVNGRKVTIPSYKVKIGDLIKIRKGSENKKIFSNLSKKLKDYNFPPWIKFDPNKIEAEVRNTPKNDQAFLNFETVLEFYSR